MRLQGVFVATLTPFDSRGNISFESYQRHLTFLSDHRVDGFVPCGTTGEGTSLEVFERSKLLKQTVAFAQKKNLTVIAGCSGNRTEKVCDLVKEAKDLGCQAALVATPYYNKPSPLGLFRHFESIAQTTDLPIVLYNIPSRTGVALPLDVTQRLFEFPNIVGIKESSGQYHQWLKLSLSMDTSQKALLAGDDDAFVAIQSLGGSGIISASANLIPGHFSSLFRLMISNQWPEAFLLLKKIAPLIKALFLESNPAPLKFCLSALGRLEPHLRLPLAPVALETEKLLLEELRRAELI